MSQDELGATRPSKRVVVIGGGPAGLMAAGWAAALGCSTLLLEKMDRPARKFSLGDRRRVLTNQAPPEQYLSTYGSGGTFLRPALTQFSSIDLVTFVEKLGIPVERERSGRFLIPEDKTEAVATALAMWASDMSVEVRSDSAATRILLENSQVSGVEIAGKKTVPADSVVLATGGMSYPETGSTGDGYTLAQILGHSIVEPRPSLVPLEIKEDFAIRLHGLILRDVAARLLVNDRCETDLVGDVEFTSFGLSGQVVLFLSRQAVDAFRRGSRVEIGLDLLPSIDEKGLEARLVSSFNTNGTNELHELLQALLPANLAAVVLDMLDLSGTMKGNQVTPAERRRLRQAIKDFRLKVTGHRSWEEAIVTAGGVSLDEVDPQTMQSRIIRGLYFAGEVLDIDGPAGGYNLQAAFSTGHLAGRSAAAGA